MSEPTDADIYKESLQSARQLSTLRFAILTVFMTATGALLGAYYSQGNIYPRGPVALGGLWLSVVFLAIELVLSFNMACLNAAAKKRIQSGQEDSFAHRKPWILWSVRILIPSIHVFIAMYWLSLLLKC